MGTTLQEVHVINSPFIKKIIEIVVFGNFWISLGAASLTINTYLIKGWEINWLLVVLAFTATLFTYNFQRIARHREKMENASGRHLWILGRKNGLIGLVALAGVVSVILFFLLFRVEDLLLAVPLLVVAILYAVNFIGKSNRKALRDLPVIKIFLIAVSWGVVTVLVPVYHKIGFQFGDSVSLFAVVCIYILAITIPFDVRDLPHDEKEKNTLPQLLGVKKSLVLSGVLLIAVVVISFFQQHLFYGIIAVCVVSIVLVNQTSEKKGELFYTGILDGLIILFPLSTWIAYQVVGIH